MTDREITEAPPLDPDQTWSLDMHSVLNVFNVLRGELMVIGIVLNRDTELLSTALGECDRVVEAVKDPARALDVARGIGRTIGRMQADIESARGRFAAHSSDREVMEAIDNLNSVFGIVKVRAQELVDRVSLANRWTEHSIAALRQNFVSVFQAIEKNSHGRYRIIYNAALTEPSTYYVDFKLEGIDGDRLWMPPVFQDVMRDLVANARKYTPPGGRITAAVHEGPELLRFVVEDNGRGIPADEIPNVFKYGYRASNVADVRTMGGGFGLTKALVVTKRFGGQFWIASEVGVGTRIRIHLPRPREG